jgi:hypothetical protein
MGVGGTRRGQPPMGTWPLCERPWRTNGLRKPGGPIAGNAGAQ